MKKNYLTKQIYLKTSLLFIISVLFFSMFIFVADYLNTKVISNKLAQKNEATKKEEIKTTVENNVKQIEKLSEYKEREIFYNVEVIVNELHTLINIFQKNSSAELNSTIVNILNNKQLIENFGYLFVINEKNEYIYFRAGKMEKDSLPPFFNQKEAIDKIVEYSKQQGTGIEKWTYNIETPQNNENVVSGFLDYYPTTGYTVGYGLPENSIHEIEKKYILEMLSELITENEKFYITNYNGELFLSGNQIFNPTISIYDKQNSNLNVSANELRAANQRQGAYFFSDRFENETDTTQKITYIRYLSHWNWILGSYTFMEDKNPFTSFWQLKTDSYYYIYPYFMLIPLLLTIFIYFLLIKQIKFHISNGFAAFSTFVNGVTNFNDKEDTKNRLYHEFRILADLIEKMITNREVAEKQLEKEMALLRCLLDSIPDLIYFKDNNKRYVGCNKAFEKFIGKNESEIIGKTDFELFNKMTAIQNLDLEETIFNTKKIEKTERWITFPDNTERLYELLYSVYLSKDAEIQGILSIARDITDIKDTEESLRREKERAEEGDRLKSAFLANMSHEIRTPMNAIIGFSNLLSMDDLSKTKQKEFISLIKSNGDALLSLINDIIDISKIEAGQLQIYEDDCSLNKLMGEIYASFVAQLQEKNINKVRLLWNSTRQIPNLNILTDSKRVRQVLVNLISNAIKFTEQGHIEFGYSIEDNYIKFFVKDTGIGIKKNDIPHIFNRFIKVVDTKTKLYGGAGLGLSISKNLIELLGGKIWVESEIDQGSMFFFTIPYYPVEDAAKQETNDWEIASNFDWENKTILIAEDVDSNFKLVSEILSKTHVHILRARNGKEAVEITQLKHDYINLIIMDIQMPIMNGIDATKKIKKMFPSMPIVALTAYAMASERQESINAGCSDYITKPLDYNVFFTKLNHFLN